MVTICRFLVPGDVPECYQTKWFRSTWPTLSIDLWLI